MNPLTGTRPKSLDGPETAQVARRVPQAMLPRGDGGVKRR